MKKKKEHKGFYQLIGMMIMFVVIAIVAELKVSLNYDLRGGFITN